MSQHSESVAIANVTPTYDVPAKDAADLDGMFPVEEQRKIRVRLAYMKQIAESGNVNKACRAIARRAGHQRGWAANRIRNLYYAYHNEQGAKGFPCGDWRILADWTKARGRGSKLPRLFIQKLWCKLCEDNQRVTSEAWRELKLIYETQHDSAGNCYKEIPGYATWPEPTPETGLPSGWTYGNLAGYAPDKVELTAARIGIAAASNRGLMVRTSRVGLRFAELLEFDDHEFDVKINFPGVLRTLRPRCFGALDVLSDCCFSLVSKPTFWDANDRSKKVLTENDFMWFIIHVLTEFGYRADIGTLCNIEWGVSTVRGHKTLPLGDPLRDDLEQRIYDVTESKVTFQRGGRRHKPAHGGQFATQSGGNPRHKRLIEGFWRLLNDRLAGLPGQTGLDRNHSPEEMQRADAYVESLLKVAPRLPLDHAAQLIVPRLTWTEFTRFVGEKLHALNTDASHDIEGWEKCGFVLPEWRRGDRESFEPLSTLMALEAGERESLLPAVLGNDLLYRVRRLARFEVVQRHRAELKRLSYTQIPYLVGRENALRKGAPLTVRNEEFEFEDWRISPEPVRFLAVDATGNPLRDGERYVCFVNPMSPSVLVACDARLCAISVCPAREVPAANDADGVKRQLGLQQSWYKRKLTEQRERHASDGEAVDFMRQHNAAVLRASGVGKAEDLAGRAIKEPAAPRHVEDCTEDLLARESASEAVEDY